jgi:prevent-host-death family protein
MPDVGVRKLKAHASEIIRQVREDHARYIITHRGRPVAILTPLEPASGDETGTSKSAGSEVWDELARLGEEIGRGWKSPLTSTELLSQMRR